ncbi:hypothetical protein [Hyphobacterium sp.]|uniref:hypothetical protein n=1 Tax=Hyphobacterium sp. TaxID=2004662 RepID=UPI003747BF80
MIELFAALLLQSATPEAQCDVVADVSRRFGGREITSLHADCSNANSDPGLHARANEVLSRVDLDLRWDRVGQYASSIVFEMDESGVWQPLPGQVLVLTVPQFPTRSVERGNRHMACDYALWPNALGQAVNINSTCWLDGPDTDHDRQLAARAMNEALENSRFLPLDYGYCFTDGTSVTAQVVGERPAPEMPAREEPERSGLCSTGDE